MLRGFTARKGLNPCCGGISFYNDTVIVHDTIIVLILVVVVFLFTTIVCGSTIRQNVLILVVVVFLFTRTVLFIQSTIRLNPCCGGISFYKNK